MTFIVYFSFNVDLVNVRTFLYYTVLQYFPLIIVLEKKKKLKKNPTQCAKGSSSWLEKKKKS